TLEIGWVEPLIPGKLALELNGNVTWFGDNPRAGAGHARLTQQPTYQLQPWVHYYVSPKASVGLGYFGQFGGVQQLDGFSNGLRSNEHAIRANVQYFFTPTLQLSTTVAHDVAVTGGFRQVFLLDVRLALVF
ncbi:MAG TPA: transporter, partial [Acetobacteraceae bacterium]|nr:transporter [Acetobacteraceae bacterium]